ncbi:hypothetical protein GCM10027566_24940 [Arachidicoccus ginsenosidivorans]|uniref:DUF3347 domain-containing protein n=1 Tax=Arachidicoccus ginsenosidivorans TaxID=496057 RepID=A0A5B8VP15_9BACT|nr:DUF3347 domain-containing protein [Arachidicoccus ginsenosidivorans]QEC73290.1 DUF3347 domain-containing protein [Arachidicoccus ginsenosidivorans]
MKTLMFIVAVAATTLAACSNPQKTNAKTTAPTEQTAQAATVAATGQNANVDEVITHYLHVKNALTADNSKEAATAGGQLHTALVNLGKQTMTAAQKKAYTEIANDAEENAEHISENGGKIKHQREHFQNLSGDIYDLVKAFGTSQTLYKDYCPMAKASWLSEVKDIKNPYLGKSMPTCGSVKETISK